MSELTSARLLLNARKKLGLTQAEVATRAGLNANSYAKLERGEGKPARESIKGLKSALQLSPEEVDLLL